MAGRRTLYSPETHRAIVAGIRAGGYDWVAAQAAGVSRSTFRRWMRLGERKAAVEPYRTLAHDVHQARSQARLSAEIEVRKEQPFNWLRFGPGREREEEPGWTESREIKHTGSFEVTQSEEWLLIATTLDEVLKPHAEARLAVAAALRKLGAAKDEP
jgi:hypothetical protein